MHVPDPLVVIVTWIFFLSRNRRIRSVKSDITSYYLVNYNAGITESIFHTFSSHAGGKDDMVQEAASGDEMDDESTSDSELSEGVNGTETDVGKNKTPSALTKAILAAPMLPASKVLDKWVQEGNKVNIREISKTTSYLRRWRLFIKALQLSDWTVSIGHLELTERKYASRVDLIAKVCGIFRAEEYIQQIPESYRGEYVYWCLLANMVLVGDAEKSEKLFNKMKNLFPLSCFSCNLMLLLYKRTNRKKIGDVLLLMEKQNVKASVFTYNTLIDLRGQSNDISGMERILEEMKSNGVEPNASTRAYLARGYAISGLKDTAEAVLKEMEVDDVKKNRRAWRFLLPAYAALGRADEVRRFWKACESNTRVSTIEAWGKLKRIEDAEAIFEQMLKIVKQPSAKHYTVLLNIYSSHNMLAEAKDLTARMAKSGVTDFRWAWEALVKLYVRVGEVMQAESILERYTRRRKPFVTSYLTILDHYANRGDVHNAEKVFLRMKQVGFPVRIRSYRSLLHAYVYAKTPAYGFAQRMEADKIIPDKALSILLTRASAVRNSDVAKLLE
ncbi:hypothetical protein ACS0TY_031826 [Phlomoides rotata]